MKPQTRRRHRESSRSCCCCYCYCYSDSLLLCYAVSLLFLYSVTLLLPLLQLTPTSPTTRPLLRLLPLPLPLLPLPLQLQLPLLLLFDPFRFLGTLALSMAGFGSFASNDQLYRCLHHLCVASAPESIMALRTPLGSAMFNHVQSLP